MNFSLEEVLKELKIGKTIFYRYLKNSSVELKNMRNKVGNVYFYNEKFIESFKKIINEKEVTKKEKKDDSIIDVIKKQYDGIIFDLKNDKKDLKNEKSSYIKQVDFLQKQLNKKDNLLIEKTEKVEKLLLSLVKVINDNKQIENKVEKSSENIIEQVKEKIENQNEIEKEKQKYKLSLEKSNEQLEEYKKYKQEKKVMLQKLKDEYNKLKFYNIIKRKQLQNKILEISSKEFEFIKYIG